MLSIFSVSRISVYTQLYSTVLHLPRVNFAGHGLGNQGGAVFLEQLDLPAESGEKGVNTDAFGVDVRDDGALFGKDRRPL